LISAGQSPIVQASGLLALSISRPEVVQVDQYWFCFCCIYFLLQYLYVYWCLMFLLCSV